MPPPTKIAYDSLNVKRHAAVRGHQIIAAVFKEKPAGSAAGTGQSCTTGIEGTDTADETIGSDVSMTADYDVGVGSGEQWPELLIGDAGFYPWAVVGSR